jgi:acetyl esterase/lipase
MALLDLARTSASLFVLVVASVWAAASDARAADSKPSGPKGGDSKAVVELWPEGAPGSAGKQGEEAVRVAETGDHVVSNVHRPSITVYAPAGKATGAGVLVMPGGGHRELWVDHEGHAVARWLSEHGIAAFVLKYRLARQEGSAYGVESHALPDAARALRTIRARAQEWQVDPTRLGVLGFSAGGELAALSAQRGSDADPKAAAPVDRESSRAAFQVLVYPGRSESIAPTAKSAPAFLLCGENDRPDISRGLANVYLRFKEAGVSAELHILAGAGHGFGVRPANRGATGRWPELVRGWLDDSGFLSPAAAASKP